MYEPNAGVVNQALGTGTVVEQQGDIVTVKFDKNGEIKKIKEDFLQPSNHQVIPLPEKKKGPGKKPSNDILPSGEFEQYLLEHGCFIGASMPPKKFPKFEHLYEQATGYKITKETPGIAILPEGTKRWDISMYVRFPMAQGVTVPYQDHITRPANHPEAGVISNNGFVLELLRHGFVLGRNDVQAAADALGGASVAASLL
jgi:hypothetical protein